jgi:hypothetical protein
MNAHSRMPGLPAKSTSFEVSDIDRIRSAIVRKGVDYWLALRGARAFPTREDIRPRDIAPILTNMVIAKVVDGGLDFELRIVGDEVSRAHCTPLINRRLSEIQAELPRTVDHWIATYRRVMETRMPSVIFVDVGYEAPEVNYTYAEIACLPLGPSDDVVDHLVTFGERAMTFSENPFTQPG